MTQPEHGSLPETRSTPVRGSRPAHPSERPPFAPIAMLLVFILITVVALWVALAQDDEGTHADQPDQGPPSVSLTTTD